MVLMVFFQDSGWIDSDVLKTIGLGELDEAKTEKKDFIKLIRQKQKCYEAQSIEIKGVLKKNITQFGEIIGLSEFELKIFEFAVAISSHRGLENAGDTLGSLSRPDVVHYLS